MKLSLVSPYDFAYPGGAGKLPDAMGSIGKGLRAFKKAAGGEDDEETEEDDKYA